MKTLQTMACAIAFAMPHVAATQANPPDADADSAASRLPYKSAFDDYKAYEDVPVANWRQVNDTVRRAAAEGAAHAAHDSRDSGHPESASSSKETAPPHAPAEQHGAHGQPAHHGMQGIKGMHRGHGMHGGHQ